MVGRKVVDVSAIAVAKHGGLGGEGEGGRLAEVREKIKRFRVAGGETREAEMPVECAQLVFPEVDARAEAEVMKARKEEGEEQLNVLAVVDVVKGKSKSAGKFVNGYMDRRAAMEFVSVASPNELSANVLKEILSERADVSTGIQESKSYTRRIRSSASTFQVPLLQPEHYRRSRQSRAAGCA